VYVKTVSSSRTVVQIKIGVKEIKRMGKRRGVYGVWWGNLKVYMEYGGET